MNWEDYTYTNYEKEEEERKEALEATKVFHLDGHGTGFFCARPVLWQLWESNQWEIQEALATGWTPDYSLAEAEWELSLAGREPDDLVNRIITGEVIQRDSGADHNVRVMRDQFLGQANRWNSMYWDDKDLEVHEKTIYMKARIFYGRLGKQASIRSIEWAWIRPE